VGGGIYYHSHKTYSSAVVWAVLLAVLGGLAAFIAVFLLNLCRSRNLPDKPRRLSYKQRQRLSEVLRGHSPGEIILMSYYRGVSDAGNFGVDIIEAFRAGGWCVDIENKDLADEPQHS